MFILKIYSEFRCKHYSILASILKHLISLSARQHHRCPFVFFWHGLCLDTKGFDLDSNNFSRTLGWECLQKLQLCSSFYAQLSRLLSTNIQLIAHPIFYTLCIPFNTHTHRQTLEKLNSSKCMLHMILCVYTKNVHINAQYMHNNYIFDLLQNDSLNIMQKTTCWNRNGIRTLPLISDWRMCVPPWCILRTPTMLQYQLWVYSTTLESWSCELIG